MIHDLVSIELRTELDVVATRQRAREIAALLGLKSPEQTSLATAVSELARQSYRNGAGASVTFALRAEPASIIVRLVDSGSGSDRASAGPTSVVTARRLVDEYSEEPGSERAIVTIAKHLPRRSVPVTPDMAASIVGALAKQQPRDPMLEVQQQNRELIQAFEELQKRQAEVERLNAELAETNRGVLALYAELDEKAESLRRASEHKTRFLSDMTHELRTPLNAMISLSRLLLDRVDGELSTEQERQVTLISRSATSLNEMVSDLLDIARIEAGKEDVRVTSFALPDLLSALRGMFRPLTPPKVRLRIDDALGVHTLATDERKLTQILRNLLSNAIKFTQAGEVSLVAGAVDGDRIRFLVSDTGIGITAADLPRIFADFEQVDGPIQRRLRGTGLGLPLTRKLARLLGGDVDVQSQPGIGSTFIVTLPQRLDFNRAAETPTTPERGGADGSNVTQVPLAATMTSTATSDMAVPGD